MEQQNTQKLDEVLNELQQSKALNKQQAEQITELMSRFSDLEKMHVETLKKLEYFSKEVPLPDDVKNSVRETASIDKQVRGRLNDLVDRLVKSSKQTSQAVLKTTIKALQLDSFLTSLSAHLKNFAEKLGQLEQKIQGLGVEQKIPQPEVKKAEETAEIEMETIRKPRVRIGERRPEFVAPQRKTKNKQKAEPEVIEKVSEEVIPPVVEQEKNVKENMVSQGLPEDFRPILENMFIPIDAAHETKDEEGRPTYGYRVNQRVDVPGIPLESTKGLDSINISKLLRADLVERIMDKRLSVDEVFTEEQKDQMISSYSKAKLPLNAFEKRVAKAEGVKKEVKATVSQEITQEKHRSR